MKSLDLSIVDFLIRLAIAAGLGVAIGFERQWRQRSAGLHTSSLVAIGAALFALLDQTINAGDATRIVAGVVTGVGFIAGGVIFRSGFTISGLNTAATIWATAGVGALAGFGLWAQASAGAAAIIALNLVLQPLAEAINVRARDRQEGETIYKITILCDPDAQSAVSNAILNTISGSTLSLQSLTRHSGEGRSIELNADVYSEKPQDAKIEALSTKLSSTAGVSRTDWISTTP
jgi:putative Mg2+ transporter-C (MgtC) family protein